VAAPLPAPLEGLVICSQVAVLAAVQAAFDAGLSDSAVPVLAVAGAAEEGVSVKVTCAALGLTMRVTGRDRLPNPPMPKTAKPVYEAAARPRVSIETVIVAGVTPELTDPPTQSPPESVSLAGPDRVNPLGVVTREHDLLAGSAR
jgi:hypothetical protein